MRFLDQLRAPGDRAAVDPPPAAPEPSGTAPRAQMLLASGIFDREFYSASVGARFTSDLEAARHCVKIGMPSSHSPSPLLDIASLPRNAQELWRGSKIKGLLAFLASPRGMDTPYSPAFAPSRMGLDADEAARHPGGALGLFLATAGPETPMPVPQNYPTVAPAYGELRAALVDRVAETEAQRLLGGARVATEWDTAGEQEWVARVSRRELAEADGPLVSIVLPVRNRPVLVARAIESVQRQSLAAWELIVVDDGSEDDTPKVVAELGAADPRVRLLRRDHQGVSAARNAGLKAARGGHVAFLDSDNTWRPTFLELALRGLATGEAGYAAARLVDGQTGAVTYRAFLGGLGHLMVKNHIDLNTVMVPTALANEVGGFDTTLRRWVDHDFVIKVSRRVPMRLLPFIACDYDDDRGAADRITTTEPESWQFVVLGNNWVDWKGLRHAVDDRSPEVVSVVIPTYQDWRMTTHAVTALLDASPDQCLEVIVIDNGSFREVGTQLVASFVSDLRVRYVRLPRNFNFAVGCNVGFALSTGSRVVFLNNDTTVRPGWLEPLMARLDDDTVRGAQSLLLYPDDTIQTAGTVFLEDGFLPTHFLVGHPPEDAAELGPRRFDAVTAAALAVRADEFAQMRGFDPIFVNGMEDVDLCLRLVRAYGGGFVVEPASRVTHLESKTPGRGTHIAVNRQRFMERWRGQLPAADRSHHPSVGLTVAHLASDGSAIPSARPVVVRRRVEQKVSEDTRLRWGLKLPSIPGPMGDSWGDTHFASSLASALGELGQQVVSYRHGAHHSTASHLDDVVLGLRGLDVVRPQPGKLNVLWVISHPELVTAAELDGFDLVFAASETWSHQMSQRSGRSVTFLPQAVDTRTLPPTAGPTLETRRLVFVGKTHPGRLRLGVATAAAADVGLAVYGGGWSEVGLAAYVESEYVDNRDVTSLYRRYGLVLADHWPDMARNGFVANRVFDAVAAGACVISDEVSGVEEMFHGAVRTYRDAADIRRLVTEQDSEFPLPEEMSHIARRVASEHSFMARAEVLLAAVRAVGTPSLIDVGVPGG